MKNQTFIAGYIESALWSSTDDEGKPLDSRFDRRDLAPEALAVMESDCDRFLDEETEVMVREDFSRAGIDFWLTRNHHGAGFWDGDWPEESGKKLTAKAHGFGECNLYETDGKLYVM